MTRLKSIGFLLVALVVFVGCSGKATIPGQAPEQSKESSLQTQPSQPPESVVQPPASKGLTLMAIDPSGATKPENLFTSEQSLQAMAMSPDGRYVLMYIPSKEDQFAPYLLDRNSGQVQQGKPVALQLNSITWSGKGFWIGGLVHLDLHLQVETFPQLRKALGLDDGMQLVATSFSADGNLLAALVGPTRMDPSPPSPPALNLDLILAKIDGTSLVRVEKAVQPWFTERRVVAGLSLSPDGSRLAITAASPLSAIVNTSDPKRARWRAPSNMIIEGPVSTSPGTMGPPGGQPLWSPDGHHVWMPMVGIVAPDGTVSVPESGRTWGLIWQPDGNGLLLGIPSGGYGVAKMGGGVTNLVLPSNVRILGYLPDGRWLAETR